MKNNILYAALAVSFFLCASCVKENGNGENPGPEPTPTPVPEGPVTITASLPELADTKVTASENADALELSWAEDDYLTVVSGDVSEKFSLVSIDGNLAVFTGNYLEGESFDVILSRSEDYASRTYEGQVQASPASTEHLVYDALLKGVTTYENITFTDEWAEQNGGELFDSGCLLLDMHMPEDVGKIKNVSLEASSAVFYTTNSADSEKVTALSLAFPDVDMVSGNIVKAHIMTSMQEASVAAGEELVLTVVSNLGTWSKKFTPGAFTLEAGRRNVITIDDKDWTLPEGDGSEAAPYIIRTAEDMNAISGRLDAEVKKHFAVVNDIDMTAAGVWTAPSQASPYPPIDFNGNNRTISNLSVTNDGKYAGLIGVLNGNLYDLTMTSVYVSGGTKVCGFACGYCGTGAIQGFVENVHVQGTFDIGSTGGVGGIAGVLGNGTIKNCSADVAGKDGKVPGQRIGGIAGYHNDTDASSICEISNCFSTGSVDITDYAKAQKVGGIVGELHAGNKSTSVAVVSNCYSTLDITTKRNFGGIAGNADANDYSKIDKCIAWNKDLVANAAASDNFCSGAVLGCTRKLVTVTDCVRRPDMNFDYKLTDLENYVVNLCDHENITETKPSYVGPETDTPYDYLYAHHGKAAAAGETVSDVAKRLGWDETIWDLSGEYPQLIK